jgi:ribosomal protein L37AE/L43A
MDRESVPACPKCKGNRVFRVTRGAVQTWRCACEYKWPVSEADKRWIPGKYRPS